MASSEIYEPSLHLYSSANPTFPLGSDMSTPSENAEPNLQCMDVWGGNISRNTYLQRPGLDVWVWSDPKSRPANGGGDLHLLSSCASGRITRFLLADICSLGSQFHQICGNFRDLLKRHLNSIQQAKAVREMSRQLDSASAEGGFASTLIGTYFATTRTLSLCNAGHPQPLLYRAGEKKWSVIRPTSSENMYSPPTKAFDLRLGDTPDGVMAEDEYQNFETKLDFGDLFFSYSNSLTECRGSNGRTIGVTGIQRRLAALHADSPASLAQQLVEQLRDESSDNLQEEDATIIIGRASQTKVGWRDNLLAPLRLMRSASDHTDIE